MAILTIGRQHTGELLVVVTSVACTYNTHLPLLSMSMLMGDAAAAVMMVETVMARTWGLLNMLQV